MACVAASVQSADAAEPNAQTMTTSPNANVFVISTSTFGGAIGAGHR
jgi:hypothetical protein